MPFFAEEGYASYALSLRSQGSSDRVDGAAASTLRGNADDLVTSCVMRSHDRLTRPVDALIAMRHLTIERGEWNALFSAKPSHPSTGSLANVLSIFIEVSAAATGIALCQDAGWSQAWCTWSQASFVGTLSRPPVVVAHSFGGLLLQRCEWTSFKAF
jgi:hypothetical protein